MSDSIFFREKEISSCFLFPALLDYLLDDKTKNGKDDQQTDGELILLSKSIVMDCHKITFLWMGLVRVVGFVHRGDASL